MLTKVLVPLDGSSAAETVLPYGELLASRTGAQLHLLTVVSEYEDEKRVSQAFTYLQDKEDELRGRSLQLSKEVTAGDEAEVILREAETRGADLIAMSTHGRSGLMRWVLGSVADKVVHRTTRPLLLVRAREDEERLPVSIGHILVPLDGSSLSLSVLPYVEDLAQQVGASLILYNGVLPVDTYPGAEVTPAGLGGLMQDLEAQGQEFLAKVAREVEARGKAKVRTVVTIGFPVDEIVRVAHETNAGLIAMATHGRSGMDRWVMGSVTDGVVRRSTVPCLLVRPDEAVEEEN